MGARARAQLRYEPTACDPKDGDLFPGKLKPGETLVEGCSRADVQIAGQIWV